MSLIEEIAEKERARKALKIKNKLYYEKHKDTIKKKANERYALNAEALKQSSRAYYGKHTDIYLVYKSRSRAARKKRRQYYLDHIEHIKEQTRLRTEAHPELHKQACRQYYLEHKAKYREYNQKDKAKQLERWRAYQRDHQVLTTPPPVH